jgi:hypothetical protein
MALKKMADPKRAAEVLAGLRRDKAVKEKGYRAQALKIFPHICGSCGREFSGKRLRELTVHHKDSDYKNNPPDGSNWELLCLFCHDHEHEKHKMKGYGSSEPARQESSPFASPFDSLGDAL